MASHTIVTKADVWIGTSGWTYDGWRGRFYPREVPKKRWLSWYAEQFKTTEVNGSFYRTPSLETVHKWRDATPADFLFSWKASRFITHWKRLSANCKNSLELMESRLKVLWPKIGPVLFQLPERFTADRERLALFLRMLSRRYKYAFEFRDESWYDDAILEVLGNGNIALCLSDHQDAPAPWRITAGHVYIRGHGPTGQYKGRYGPKALQQYADAIAKWKRRRLDVYCYFDNDQKSAAPKDARQLVELMSKKRSSFLSPDGAAMKHLSSARQRK